MTVNETSLRLNMNQKGKVAYIVKSILGYRVGTKEEWALENKKRMNHYSTLKEVKSAIENIVSLQTKEEKKIASNKLHARVLKADYEYAKSIGNKEIMRDCIEKLKILGELDI